MGSGGYHWKYEERGKRKRLRGRGNLGLSDKPQRGLLTPLVVLALSSHLTVWVSFIVPSRSLHGLISIQTQTSTSQRLKMACTGVSFQYQEEVKFGICLVIRGGGSSHGLCFRREQVPLNSITL